MDEIRTGPHGDGGQDYGHGPRGRGALSDAEAERLLRGPWALNVSSGAENMPGAGNGNEQPRPSDLPHFEPSALPGFGPSAVAGNPARVAYSAGWDGADDPSGHAGARGPAGAPGVPGTHGAWDVQGVQDPAAAGDRTRRDQFVGSADSGGEMTVSSVDFPIDLASPDAQAVARLLAAAAGPPRPHELRGYDAARRAFERAGTTPARRGAGLPLRRLMGVKAAAVTGVLTVTGVAVAAEADVLPSPIQRVAHQVLGGVGVPDPEPDAPSSGPLTSASSSSSAHPGTPQPTGASGASSGGNGTVPGTPNGTAGGPVASTATDTDILALCRAFIAQDQGTGGPLAGKDKHRLATLAGGEDKIADYCARRLTAVPSTPPPDGSPSGTSAPNPSKDHSKPSDSPHPATTTPPSTTGGGDGNGHSHTPTPSMPTHALH